MKVVCEHCGATYDVQDEKVPTGGMTMKCPKCLSTFRVMPPGVAKAKTILGLGLSDIRDPGQPVMVSQGAAGAASTATKSSPHQTAEPTADNEDQRPLFVKRFTGRVFGPFPHETIKTMLEEGKLDGTEEVSVDQSVWKAILSLSVLKPAQAGSAGANRKGMDLPSPKRKPDKGLDLPSPKGKPDKGLDLPIPKGKPDKGLDLPSPKRKPDKGLDLPIPKGKPDKGLDLPIPKGRPDKGLDLPSPKGKSDKGLDLPGPRGTE
ncbi:MAG: zinc-ribbon domain-containing protein, partial [Deltaproteobacteria bacterium]|nr:zinc-ribbon domain-containing protein [Deltaproteobacteria bacterium]